VSELFTKHVGQTEGVPSSPVQDSALTMCHAHLQHSGGVSCCTPAMEHKLLNASEEYIHELVGNHNHELMHRINESLRSYQEHLTASLQEAQELTSQELEKLYNIPRAAHGKALEVLFTQLQQHARGTEVVLEDAVANFFTHLFPPVFTHVLMDKSRGSLLGDDFNACLMDYNDDIKPFGKVPGIIGARIKHAFRRARVFRETLHVMQHTISFTQTIRLHPDCRRAVTRMQFCSLCGGHSEVKPCRGMCLNVVRGCLASVADVSNNWDDLVVAFENLQLGLVQRKDVQDVLGGFTGNISEALLQAMGDMSRIHKEVTSLCSEFFRAHPALDAAPSKHFSTAEGLRPVQAMPKTTTLRKDIALLIKELEESKGFFQRLADGLCRNPILFEQEMEAGTCWNGSAVGRYMHVVPEANMIAQVQDNREVSVSLKVDRDLLEVKDTLTHMTRNLTKILNDDAMQSDSSYTEIMAEYTEASGAYSSASNRDDTDDEDLVRGGGSGWDGSGAGHQGSGDKSTDDGSEEWDTRTVTGQTDKPAPTTGRGSTRRPVVIIKPTDPTGHGDQTRASISLLLAATVATLLHHYRLW